MKPLNVKEKPIVPQKKKIKPLKTIIGISIALLLGAASFLFTKSILSSSIIALLIFFASILYFFLQEKLKVTTRIRKMEFVFPDFIELMAANLRAGMTIDRALLLSSRKEFDPLDKEILILGKNIVAGRDVSAALQEMSKRINSDKINKTVGVINSGIKSGGNIAILLEETAVNMREKAFIEKRASSNVLMYMIFIFFAIAVGAPALFSLSSVLVQVLSTILGSIPEIKASVSLPFTLTSINISVRFITYFSLTFLIAIDIMASMLLGLVSKGERKEGLKFALPLIASSISVYFIIRFFLLNYFSGLLG